MKRIKPHDRSVAVKKEKPIYRIDNNKISSTDFLDKNKVKPTRWSTEESQMFYDANIAFGND